MGILKTARVAPSAGPLPCRKRGDTTGLSTGFWASSIVGVALQNAQKPTHLVPQFVPQQVVMLDEDFQQQPIENPYLESKITLTETNIPIASLSKNDVPHSSFPSIGVLDKIEKRSAQMPLPMTEPLVSEKPYRTHRCSQRISRHSR
jgi:hypothetical protein